jgi:hypothetical protein
MGNRDAGRDAYITELNFSELRYRLRALLSLFVRVVLSLRLPLPRGHRELANERLGGIPANIVAAGHAVRTTGFSPGY